jgi:Family of unknown function (DUF6460)
MDRSTLTGGTIVATIFRLAVISLVVGIVLSALGINLRNFFDRINALLRNIYDLGFASIDWLLQYMLLGAAVVLPIWLISRLFSAGNGRAD